MKNRWWNDKKQKKIVSEKISKTMSSKPNKPTERFNKIFSKFMIIRKNGCWDFTGSKSPIGFGSIRYRKKTYSASRFAYEIHYGDIKKNNDEYMFVSHSCCNNSCINPKHLILLTPEQAHNNRMIRNVGKISELSEEQKYEIKRLYIEDGIPRAELRKRFNTSIGIINFIIDNLYQDFKIKID